MYQFVTRGPRLDCELEPSGEVLFSAMADEERADFSYTQEAGELRCVRASTGHTVGTVREALAIIYDPERALVYDHGDAPRMRLRFQELQDRVAATPLAGEFKLLEFPLPDLSSQAVYDVNQTLKTGEYAWILHQRYDATARHHAFFARNTGTAEEVHRAADSAMRHSWPLGRPGPNDPVPEATRRFERTMSRLYPEWELAVARFWVAVDSHGFRHATDLLSGHPKEFGVMFRHHRRRGDPRPSRFMIVDQAAGEAKEAFLFRGLRPPPREITGPMASLAEREERSRARVMKIVRKLYSEPDHAMTEILRFARYGTPRATAEALTGGSPRFGQLREPPAALLGSDLRRVSLWAAKVRRLADPVAYRDRARARFHRALARHFVDADAAMRLWTRHAQQLGPHSASSELATKEGPFRAIAVNPRPAHSLEALGSDYARAERRAYNATGVAGQLCEPVAPALVPHLLDWSDASRHADAELLQRRTLARTARVEELQANWTRARRQLETAAATARTQLAAVVRDPEAVTRQYMAGSDDVRYRMLLTLTSAPTLAEREFGPAGVLVEARGFRHRTRTAEAIRGAPVAARWLKHLADSTTEELTARRALADGLHQDRDVPPAALESTVESRLVHLRTRTADLDLLVNELSKPRPLLSVVPFLPEEVRHRLAWFGETRDDVLTGIPRPRAMHGLEVG